MTSRNPRAITEADVPSKFDAATVQSLASIGRLPQGCDLDRFGASVQNAARIYARDVMAPSNNERRKEVAELSRLARGKSYEKLAKAVENMSPAVRAELQVRQAHIADRVADWREWPGGSRKPFADLLDRWRIPKPAELRDPAIRAAAAEGLEALSSNGGGWVEGRMRPTGRRSRTWRPELHAPKASRAEPRRGAERDLVMWLQVAVAETGAKVPMTAHHDKPGPFARMVAKVLVLVGATGPANSKGLAVEIIKQLHREAVAQGKDLAAASHPFLVEIVDWPAETD